MSAEAFVASARSFVGKAKWRHRGRKPWAMDCLGLVDLAGVEAGIGSLSLKAHESNYGREPWDDLLRKGCTDRWGEALPPEEAVPGDVVLLRMGTREPSHIGIVGDHPQGGLSLIHAHNLLGVVEQRIDERLQKLLIEVYRPWRAKP